MAACGLVGLCGRAAHGSVRRGDGAAAVPRPQRRPFRPAGRRDAGRSRVRGRCRSSSSCETPRTATRDRCRRSRRRDRRCRSGSPAVSAETTTSIGSDDPDWQAFSSRLSRTSRSISRSARTRPRVSGSECPGTSGAGRRLRAGDGVERATGRTSTVSMTGERGRAKRKMSLDLRVEHVEARDHRVDHALVVRIDGRTRAQDLQRALDAGERIAHLVRDDGRQLPELRQRRLIDELLLDRLALRDVAADRDVLPRLALAVEQRHDRGVDPVDGAVLGAVPQLAAPHLSLRDGPPQRRG